VEGTVKSAVDARWQIAMLTWGEVRTCCTLQNQKSFIGFLCMVKRAPLASFLDAAEQAAMAYRLDVRMLALSLRPEGLKLIDKDVSVLNNSKGAKSR
jgi:uncharacterized ferredoxin-like protein